MYCYILCYIAVALAYSNALKHANHIVEQKPHIQVCWLCPHLLVNCFCASSSNAQKQPVSDKIMLKHCTAVAIVLKSALVFAGDLDPDEADVRVASRVCESVVARMGGGASLDSCGTSAGDVYSAGMLMCELITGHLPGFARFNEEEMIASMAKAIGLEGARVINWMICWRNKPETRCSATTLLGTPWMASYKPVDSVLDQQKAEASMQQLSAEAGSQLAYETLYGRHPQQVPVIEEQQPKGRSPRISACVLKIAAMLGRNTRTDQGSDSIQQQVCAAPELPPASAQQERHSQTPKTDHYRLDSAKPAHKRRNPLGRLFKHARQTDEQAGVVESTCQRPIAKALLGISAVQLPADLSRAAEHSDTLSAAEEQQDVIPATEPSDPLLKQEQLKSSSQQNGFRKQMQCIKAAVPAVSLKPKMFKFKKQAAEPALAKPLAHVHQITAYTGSESSSSLQLCDGASATAIAKSASLKQAVADTPLNLSPEAASTAVDGVSVLSDSAHVRCGCGSLIPSRLHSCRGLFGKRPRTAQLHGMQADPSAAPQQSLEHQPARLHQQTDSDSTGELADFTCFRSNAADGSGKAAPVAHSQQPVQTQVEAANLEAQQQMPNARSGVKGQTDPLSPGSKRLQLFTALKSNLKSKLGIGSNGARQSAARAA